MQATAEGKRDPPMLINSLELKKGALLKLQEDSPKKQSEPEKMVFLKFKPQNSILKGAALAKVINTMNSTTPSATKNEFFRIGIRRKIVESNKKPTNLLIRGEQ